MIEAPEFRGQPSVANFFDEPFVQLQDPSCHVPKSACSTREHLLLLAPMRGARYCIYGNVQAQIFSHLVWTVFRDGSVSPCDRPRCMLTALQYQVHTSILLLSS